MEATYFRCRNWHKFQHYHSGGRKLSWIKNYIELDDRSNPFSKLSFAEQGKLQAVWRLAAKLDNVIPYDEVFVARAIGAQTISLSVLAAEKWIEVGSEDEIKKLAGKEKRAANPRKKRASNVLADGYQTASLEAEQEVEEEVKQRPLVLGLDEEKIKELDRILGAVQGATTDSLRKLSPLVGGLPLGVAINVRERAVSGGKGIGWVVNAMQGEIDKRRMA